MHFPQERAAALGPHPPSVRRRPFLIRPWCFIGATSIFPTLRPFEKRKIKRSKQHRGGVGCCLSFTHPKITNSQRRVDIFLHCRPHWFLMQLHQVGKWVQNHFGNGELSFTISNMVHATFYGEKRERKWVTSCVFITLQIAQIKIENTATCQLLYHKKMFLHSYQAIR